MPSKDATTARGTLVMVFSQGCYFVFGYLTVVLLARELGPAVYGTYGIILSVLIWLEEAGRHSVPSAVTKLLAGTTSDREALEKCALALNLGLYTVFLVLLWSTAPWLESWFGIPHGTSLYRIAAIDLPFFGVYVALEAIHQGHRRFFQLGLVRILYAFAKLAGVLCVIYSGVSLEKALLANVASSLVGMLCLLPGLRLQATGQWLVGISPILTIAAPLGIYSLSQLLTGSLSLWTLKIMSPASEAAIVGIFLAALNIARVPAFALSSVSIVLLPSVSKAAAVNDVLLVKRYINQALRFLFILYLPICLVLMARPEALMLWVYSDKFAGGGVLLSILLVSQGIAAIYGILTSILIATGQTRKLAAIVSLSIIPSLLISVICVYLYGSLGAAVASVINPLIRVLLFGLLLKQQYGTLFQGKSMVNIALAGMLMFLVNALLPRAEGVFILLYGSSFVVYFVALFLFSEIGRQDLAVFLSRHKREVTSDNIR